MRKLILGVVAATVAASPMIATAAEAQGRGHGYGHNRYEQRRDRVQYRAWRKGQRFDRRYAQNYRVVDYRTYRGRGLYAPPRGYQWVQSGNDAVLVALASGVIGAIIGDAIR